MYSILAVLFLIGGGMVFAGVLGRAGTDSSAEIDANVAASMALLVTYLFLLLNFTSFSELSGMFESISGGVPYLGEIADYGSFRNLLRMAPLEAAESFLDVVFLTATVDLLSVFPVNSGSAKGKFMVKVFTGIMLSLISLLILNFVIKQSGPYQYIVAAVGAVIAALSAVSIPIAIFSLVKKPGVCGVGLLAAAVVFSTSRAAGILRDAFFKAIVYVAGIYVLESRFGSIASGMSQMSLLAVAFGPVAIMLAGIFVMVRFVFK